MMREEAEYLIEQDARHFQEQTEAEESRQYFANESVEASIIEEPPADCAWYYPTAAGLGESEMEYSL